MKHIIRHIFTYAAIPAVIACGNGNTSTSGPAAGTLTVQEQEEAAPDSIAAGTDAISGATAKTAGTTFNGTIIAPPQSHATVTLSMEGTVRETRIMPESFVRKGSVIAVIENPEFIALQQTYLDSHAQSEYLKNEFNRQKALSMEEAASRKKYEQSKAEYLSMKSRMEASAAHLTILGVDTTDLKEHGITPYLQVKAPISGFVSGLAMNTGKHFGIGEPLCEIFDKSSPMLRLTAYEKDLSSLKAGMHVTFQVNGIKGETFSAEIISIGQTIDMTSRSADVYARIKEADARFRPGMYVSAKTEDK